MSILHIILYKILIFFNKILTYIIFHFFPNSEQDKCFYLFNIFIIIGEALKILNSAKKKNK